MSSATHGNGNDEDLRFDTECSVDVHVHDVNSNEIENGPGKFVSNGNVRRFSVAESRKQQLDAVNSAVSKVLRIVLHANQAVAHHELKAAMMAGGVEERLMRNKCLLDVALLTLLDHGLLRRHGYGNWGLYTVPAEAMGDATKIAFEEFPGEDEGWVEGDGVMGECGCHQGRQDDGDRDAEFLDENMATVCHMPRSKYEVPRFQTACHLAMHTSKKRNGVQDWTACGRPAIARSPRARGAVRIAIGDRGLSRVRTGGAEKRTYSDLSGGVSAAAAAANNNNNNSTTANMLLKRARLRHHQQYDSDPMSP